MIAMLDEDESGNFKTFSVVFRLIEVVTGKLGYDEFMSLYRNIRKWTDIFKKHDLDNSNSISAGELKVAFRAVGINVNRSLLRMLINRYGHHSKESNTIESALYFEDFVCCSLKLRRCIMIWNSKKTREGGYGGFGGGGGGGGAPFGRGFGRLAQGFGGFGGAMGALGGLGSLAGIRGLDRLGGLAGGMNQFLGGKNFAPRNWEQQHAQQESSGRPGTSTPDAAASMGTNQTSSFTLDEVNPSI